MRKLKVAVVDRADENREELVSFLTLEYNCFELMGKYENAEDFIAAGITGELDVLFTNFSFPIGARGADGVYLQNYVEKNNPHCLRIFLSEDKADAYQAFLCGGFDFIAKPSDPDDYCRVMNKLYQYFDDRGYFRGQQGHSFMAKTRTGYQIIRTESTIYIELVDRLCVFHMDDGRKISLSGYSMKRIESGFTDFGFFRCHQSLLVNLAKINSVVVNNANKWYSLTLEGCTTEIPLSREKYNELLEKLKNQYSKLPN